ncbi:MAG: hypothetical protein P3A58_06315 [Gemmatimonadota bacterium]|nr:hypothetical protein [Gemmatimonadota bacterium]
MGLAIAVDSAVSIGSSGRSYPSAEKLFPLENGAPVAIAIFGSAQFIGLPWKLVIETFIARLGSQRFETLAEYQQAFLAFCASNHPLFTAELEAQEFKATVSLFWRHQLRPVFAEHGEDAREWGEEAWDAVRGTLARDADWWTPDLLPGLEESLGRDVLEAFAPQVDELREYWFDGVLPPQDIWAQYLAMIERIVVRDVIVPDLASGIVFLGYGEGEFFPGYSHVSIGSRLLGRVRWRQTDRSVIAPIEKSGSIQVFAQPDMVDAFILGIPRRMERPLVEQIEQATRTALQQAQLAEASSAAVDVEAAAEAATGSFFELLHREFRAPLMDAVAGLPTRELAGLSRTLVSLAAFRSQLALDQTGSVGGEIRVAVLTKNGGVQWAA